MRVKDYKAFTFVEMLVVMGILIILMVVGIAAGRFAINRANRVAHQNAADQLYQMLQAYYTDNRQFPVTDQDFQTMLEEDGYLYEYSEGDFNGGGPADYFYFGQTGTTRQAVLVCVTLGGHDDSLERGIYCTGNGFQSQEVVLTAGEGGATAENLSSNIIEPEDDLYDDILAGNHARWFGNGWTEEEGGE